MSGLENGVLRALAGRNRTLIDCFGAGGSAERKQRPANRDPCQVAGLGGTARLHSTSDEPAPAPVRLGSTSAAIGTPDSTCRPASRGMHLLELSPACPELIERRFNQQALYDTTPLPDDIPKVKELGASSAPLLSASFFIGARCKAYNDDYMMCKVESNGRGELDCMKEGRKVTRCAASVYGPLRSRLKGAYR